MPILHYKILSLEVTRYDVEKNKKDTMEEMPSSP